MAEKRSTSPTDDQQYEIRSLYSDMVLRLREMINPNRKSAWEKLLIALGPLLPYEIHDDDIKNIVQILEKLRAKGKIDLMRGSFEKLHHALMKVDVDAAKVVQEKSEKIKALLSEGEPAAKRRKTEDGFQIKEMDPRFKAMIGDPAAKRHMSRDGFQIKDNTPVTVALEDNGSLSPCEGNPVMGNCVSNVGQSAVASMVADEVSGLGLRQVIQNAVRGSGVKEGSFLDRLSSRMAERILLSKSENTNCKYNSAFRRWETFISSHGFPALPASPIHVALYMSNLLDKGSTYSVLNTAMYAIKWAHNVSGHTDPTTNTFVISLVEASKRVAKKPVCKKAPVTTDILITLCSMFSQTKDLLIVRDLTMMLICFSGFLSFSELCDLRCSDVQMFHDYFFLVIRKRKTDQYHQGNKVFISKGSTSACPHTMLNRYIERAGIDLKSDEYLFKQVYRSGSICKLIHKNKPISYSGARKAIIKRLKLVSDGKEFGLHSLQAGGATVAANNDVNERCCKRHGRWKSESNKDGYVADSLSKMLEVTQNLGL